MVRGGSGTPAWLSRVDAAAIVLLNAGLVIQVGIVFTNTITRWLFHVTPVLGVDETARLYLIGVAFLGGAVAYGRGRFMAITAIMDRLPESARSLLGAAVEWVVIVLALLIGGYSIPLLIDNAGERTTMLGIGFIWMTIPMTGGAALFIMHAGQTLLRRPSRAAVMAGVLVGGITLLLWFCRDGDWVDTPWFYAVLTMLFLGQIAIGVPIGFVLASIGIAYVAVTGAAPMIAVASTAQRGTGGFIFLALPFFILAGFVMDRGGIGARIIGLLSALIGHLRGGLLQVSIVGMYIVSGISGSKAADMAAIGIPLSKTLRQAGQDPHEAAAVLAASAAMGESIPPSIAILALGSVTSVSTGALFLAGLLPAGVIAVLLMLLVWLRALVRRVPPTPRSPLRVRLRAGQNAVLPLLMPVLLVGGIVAGVGTPTEISSFAVVYGLIISVAIYRAIGARGFWAVLTEASLLSGMIFFTFSGATLFSWALALEGVPDALAAGLQALGATAFLPAVIAITIVLGALLESVVTIIILGPLLLPVAIAMGVHPLQFGIVLIEAFGIGAILPPVGLALYIACAICEVPIDRVTRPLLSYLAVLCVGLLVVAFLPGITLLVPRLFNFAN